MKLYTNYNHSFSTGKDIVNPIWSVVKDIPSLNGLYITDSNYVEVSKIGTSNGSSINVETWYNALEDTNYLYSSSVKPQLVLNDSQFNYLPSIDFGNTGDCYLRYKFPVTVGTIILVYLINTPGSYIIYSPKVDVIETNRYLHYDAFPPSGTNLWGNESNLNGSVYNATSRINGKNVPANTFLPLNTIRLLTVTNIDNIDNTETIYGYGGQTGVLGGIERSNRNPITSNSFKGKLAAIITSKAIIDVDILQNIESALASIYINYQGVVLTNTPSFRYLYGQEFSFDFSTIALDEWFNIESYTLVNPLDLGLSFEGSILTGVLNKLYSGSIQIKIENSANIINTFYFNLDIVKADPIVTLLPSTNTLSLILTANIDSATNQYYGLKLDNTNKVIEWEDARRLDVPKLVAIPNKEPSYSLSADFNNRGIISFSNSDEILNISNIQAKTFVWVYIQDSYGTRQMLNTFPDIKGTGELWTVSTNSELHGNTTITKLTTKVNNFTVNTLNYKLPLSTIFIVFAEQLENTSISFKGFSNFNGRLGLFAAWDSLLDTGDKQDIVSLLANNYFNSFAPIVMGNTNLFYNTSEVVINLSNIIVDINNSIITYTILTSEYDIDIADNIATTYITTDTYFTITLRATNENSLYTDFSVNINVTLKTNSLYLGLKQLLNTFNLFLISELESITQSSSLVTRVDDYRSNGTFFTNEGAIDIINLGKLYLNFNLDGSSSLVSSSTLYGKCFIVAFIKRDTSGSRFNLIGQADRNNFSSGLDNYILDTSFTSESILNSSNYINGQVIVGNYRIIDNIFNVLVYNSQETLPFNSIAKDRIFTDKSVKGYLALVVVLHDSIDSNKAYTINKLVRDYYDVSRVITLLHFNGVLVDVSGNREVITNGTYSNTIKKFNTSSLNLVNNSLSHYVLIENNADYTFLYEDFTVSFWLAINKLSNNEGDYIQLYSMPNLVMYIHKSILYINKLIDNTTYIVKTILASELISSSYVFFNIELGRKDNIFYLFINGVLVDTGYSAVEIRDTSTYILLGDTNSSYIETGVNVYIDEFFVYRRTCLHTTDFIPLNTELIID